jgi:hypothetical protein
MSGDTRPQYDHHTPLLFIAGLPTQFSPGLSSKISSCMLPRTASQEIKISDMNEKERKKSMEKIGCKHAEAARLGNLPVSSLYMT